MSFFTAMNLLIGVVGFVTLASTYTKVSRSSSFFLALMSGFNLGFGILRLISGI